MQPGTRRLSPRKETKTLNPDGPREPTRLKSIRLPISVQLPRKHQFFGHYYLHYDGSDRARKSKFDFLSLIF